jgi:hypothetical protein
MPRPAWWLALFLAALTSLYADALRTGFLNDDYLFLEEARRHPLVESLTSLGPLGNYFRPLARQIYFETLTSLVGERPWAFHAVNYGLFLGSLALLADLLRALLPTQGVLCGVLYFAILPLQRVNLTWISCSQDLLALGFSLGSVALFRRGREGVAAFAYLLALFSKESALPLPLALAAWGRWVDPAESRPPLWRRLQPFALALLLWSILYFWMRALHPGAAPWLSFAPGNFAAAYAHGVQSLLGLDHPPGFLERLTRYGPQPLALVLLVPLALLFRRAPDPLPAPNAKTVWIGLAWLLAFMVVVGPVAATWSSYYFTLAAVGGAVLVGAALTRIGPAGWLVLASGLLWWHAGSTSARAFAIADRPWVWTSHLTPFYFQRAAALSDTLGRELLRLEPRPKPGTRFFFATLPPYAGFQMGNGAQVRALYRDPSIESYFYSRFSDSTAGQHPCRFLYWDGRELKRLYDERSTVFFQVGADLLLFDRLAGARHAFLRGLAAGEQPRADHLYWLGWTELWLMRRGAAEAAWTAFGAKDDSIAWHWAMRAARQALNDWGDTLSARRALFAALRSGIGRPEAHAVAGRSAANVSARVRPARAQGRHLPQPERLAGSAPAGIGAVRAGARRTSAERAGTAREALAGVAQRFAARCGGRHDGAAVDRRSDGGGILNRGATE